MSGTNVMKFGKYKDMTLEEIYTIDFSYLLWLVNDLEKKFDPQSKYAAQNKKQIADIKAFIGTKRPAEPVKAEPVKPDEAGNLDQVKLLRQLNINLQALIVLIQELNLKMAARGENDREIQY